jgi:MFS family permease
MIRRTFQSLAVRNYRLYFVGQLVSNIGTWCQAVAQGWLVYTLTGSGTAIGVVTALQFLPTLLGGLWAGVVADRFDRRRILLCTQAAMAVAAGALAVLTIAGVVQVWEIYLLALLSGVGTALDTPARQAFVTELVAPDNLANAIALNSAMFNASRVVGPGIAGLLIAVVGTGWCFGVNAVSFAAVIAGLLAMRRGELFSPRLQPRARRQVRDGLAYAWRTPLLRTNILLIAVVGTFGINFPVILPVLAKEVFHGGSTTYSVLSAVMALGSLAGALVVAGRARPTRTVLFGSCLAFGVFSVLAALSTNLFIAVPLLVVVGATAIAYLSTANTIVQMTCSPEMRGRVMAIYALVLLGSTPIGGPAIGYVCQHFGARAGLALGGAISLVGGIVAALAARHERDATVAAPTAGATMPTGEELIVA